MAFVIMEYYSNAFADYYGGEHTSVEQLNSLTLLLKPKVPWDKTRREESIGPYLQGALMEHVDPSYAGLLHQAPFNPYSQYCYWADDCLVWRINTLTSEAAERIIVPMQGVGQVSLRSADTEFEVVKTTRETVALKSLTDMVHGEHETKSRIRFVTPTAFKSQGTYVIVPTVRLLAQNLLMHYGQVYADDKEGYEETIEFVDKQVFVSSYRLRSSYFGHVGGGDKRIPGFVGTMTLVLRGPQITRGLASMLLKFGEYAGVGIKTSMGMGGFTCLYAT